MEFDLDALNARLDQASTEAVLDWAMGAFAGDIAISSSFQTQSVPLLHMVARTVPELPVLFLDTGYHFPQTIAFRDRLVEQWNLNLVVVEAAADCDMALPADDSPLYLTDPSRCCELYRVEPMRRAMRDYTAWISGIRRDQSAARRDARVVECTAQGFYRVHPMLGWDHGAVQDYLKTHALPEHPLTAQGYTSIGCAPCTCPPVSPDDMRSGRWSNHNKTECGLHTVLREKAGTCE